MVQGVNMSQKAIKKLKDYAKKVKKAAKKIPVKKIAKTVAVAAAAGYAIREAKNKYEQGK